MVGWTFVAFAVLVIILLAFCLTMYFRVVSVRVRAQIASEKYAMELARQQAEFAAREDELKAQNSALAKELAERDKALQKIKVKELD